MRVWPILGIKSNSIEFYWKPQSRDTYRLLKLAKDLLQTFPKGSYVVG
jgi:hypothetical protein